MIRLGLRLALSGGRWSVIPTLLAAGAVGFGTAILLFALSFQPALQERFDRTAWRDTPGQFDLAGPVPGNAVLLSVTHDFVENEPLSRMDAAALGPDAPVPPGLPRLPNAGEAFVSPALARLIAARPSEQLGDRFGRIVGEIAESGLGAPNELAVVQGQSADVLRAAGSRAVTRYDTEGQIRSLGQVLALIVAVAVAGAIAPVAIFVASATRLAAASRERRLVALRLSGATPRQVAVLAAMEALLIAIPGAIVGVGLFVLLRPIVALVPLAQLTWFVDAIQPPLDLAIALVIAVPVVGVLAALVALRPMSISPLGVARRARRRPLSRLRIVPLLVTLVLFVVSLTVIPGIAPDVAVVAVAGSFFAIIIAIAIIGPWLTVGIGRVLASRGGAIPLLAGRRLLDDPRGSFGAVAGVIVALFVASVFFGFAAFAFHAATSARVPVRPATLYAEVPGGAGTTAEDLAAALARTDGVTGVVTVREAILRDPSDPAAPAASAWIAPCSAFVAASDLPDARCGDATIHLVAASSAPTATGLAGHAPAATVVDLASPPTVELALAAGLRSERLLHTSDRSPFADPPSVLVDPVAVEGDLAAIRPAFLLVSTTGDPASIERVRTQLERAMPTSGPATGADLTAALTRTVEELGRVVSLGVVLVLLVAGCSLAVAVAGGLVDRRRPFALLRMSGVTLRNLRAVLILEAAAPLIVVATMSTALGVGISQLILRLVATAPVALPDPSLFVLFVASVLGALAIVACVLPLVRPITSLEETRFE